MNISIVLKLNGIIASLQLFTAPHVGEAYCGIVPSKQTLYNLKLPLETFAPPTGRKSTSRLQFELRCHYEKFSYQT